ncbi:hypothetical protein [Anaerosporobacter sp.]|uniref:hypothetical protein n=1 Tax=Anaerosporobacter sp. TaxID=1872529 RepID=UPI002899772B|nr:hypothetical protein [Anaerosporobacter sp.]
MKKNNGLDYKEFWKDKIDYDYETEIVIYAYVCRTSKSLPKKLYNIDKSYQFDSYIEWQYHVKGLISNKQVDLKEFKRYLINEERKRSSFSGMTNSIVIPIIIYILGLLISAFMDLYTGTILQPTVDRQISLLQNILTYLVVMVPVVAVSMTVYIALFYKIFKIVGGFSNKDKLDKSFYEDYIEIVESEIIKSTIIERHDGD